MSGHVSSCRKSYPRLTHFPAGPGRTTRPSDFRSALRGLLLGTWKAQPDALGILRASGRARAVETALAGALLLGTALVRRRR